MGRASPPRVIHPLPTEAARKWHDVIDVIAEADGASVEIGVTSGDQQNVQTTWILSVSPEDAKSIAGQLLESANQAQAHLDRDRKMGRGRP